MDAVTMAPPHRFITVEDLTSAGTFTFDQLYNLIWALWFQGNYDYNMSPWVERSYASSVTDVRPLAKGAVAPDFNIQLRDTSTQPGALGWHEDTTTGQMKFHSKVGPAGIHSTRSGTLEKPIAEVFVHTAREDGVDPTEVASHEMLEGLVDPYVMDEARIRKVLNQQNQEFYIVEVGDPVQGCGYPLGDTTVADFVWPAWYGMPQKRPDLSQRDSIHTPFELAPAGYQSVAPEAEPTNWSQIYGSDRAAGQQAHAAYEKPGEAG